jgi:hypothetical protein
LKHFSHVTEGLRLVFHGWMAVTGNQFSMYSFGVSEFAMVRVMLCWWRWIGLVWRSGVSARALVLMTGVLGESFLRCVAKFVYLALMIDKEKGVLDEAMNKELSK